MKLNARLCAATDAPVSFRGSTPIKYTLYTYVKYRRVREGSSRKKRVLIFLFFRSICMRVCTSFSSFFRGINYGRYLNRVHKLIYYILKLYPNDFRCISVRLNRTCDHINNVVEVMS